MADDINKNITIQVSAETDQLEQSITNLNKIIDNLQAQQKQLTDSGKENSAAFQNNADKIDTYQKSLQKATAQLGSFQSASSSAASALQKNQSVVTALTSAKEKYSKTVGDTSKKVNDLNTAIKTLSSAAEKQQTQIAQSQTATENNNKALNDAAQQATNFQGSITAVSEALGQQQQSVNNNKSAFNAHAEVMDHLKTSFDEIKDVSGEFGPSLKDAADGFNMMKTGLAVVKDGLYGVGDALKADGFNFLLQILQKIFDAFINSSEGTKVLKGAISAIGVVINKVKDFFGSFMKGIIDAVSHPIESIKALGNMIEKNIINRFKAFGVILDGIIHLNFKEIANGAIQAFTGVADATDKIGAAFTKVKQGVEETAVQMVTSYKNGCAQFNQALADNEKNVNASVDRQKAKLKTLTDTARDTYDNNQQQSSARSTADTLQASGVGLSPDDATDNAISPTTIDAKDITATTTTATKVVAIKKSAMQQVEDYAKQSAVKIADDALSVLTNSIKQQADAKIAALEKNKVAALNNSALTGTQKLAIEQKFRQQENAIKAKAFKEEQEISIAQATINGALAVTKVTAQGGVLAALEIGAVVAETAVQIAKIASQKPPAYARGGLHYASDGRGGVLPGYSRTDNVNAHLRSGEGVVVSEAMRDPWARSLVSAINVGFGGRDFASTNTGRGFAVGGIFTDGGNANRYYNQPVTDNKNLANTIAYQMINNFPPVYVDVKDINNQQNILAQTINRVNL